MKPGPPPYAATRDDPLLGSLVDRRYRIDALIARGGMSAVYLGRDQRLHRPVAVKVMDAAYRDDPVFSRFEFEARAVAGLKHPGLINVYDQGIDDQVVFLVMELVEGGSLRELLRERGPMPRTRCRPRWGRSSAVSAPPTRRASSTATSSREHPDLR